MAKVKTFTYNTFTGGDDSAARHDSVQNVPDVVVIGVPLAKRITYDFKKYNTIPGGADIELDFSVETKKDAPFGPYDTENPFLVNGITSCITTTSKRSHVSSLHVEFIDENNISMNRLVPGDWIMCSMFTDPVDAARVKGSVSKLVAANSEISPINGFRDGLKFVGRVQTVRRTVSTNPQTGQKIRRYKIDATGFNEFDTSVYFDPAITIIDSYRNSWIDRFFGKEYAKLSTITKTAGALPALIATLMGTGPGDGVTRIEENGKTLFFASPNGAFIVPPVVNALLGVPQTETSTYADMLTCIFGVQQYSACDPYEFTKPSDEFKQHGFIPNLDPSKTDDVTRRFFTLLELDGEIPPQITPWVNVPIWGVLQSFLMPDINEMYTCLRVDPHGRIMPHFIARQIPFTTQHLDGVKGKNKLTRFLNLPRWKIEEVQVTTSDLVRSNTMRCNYVQIKNDAVMKLGGMNYESMQRALNYPIVDSEDRARSGLYPKMVNTTNLITNNDVSKWWTAVVADRHMEGHLKLSGQIVTTGIQEPICEGDNLEYGNGVYHIEGIQHNYWVDPQVGSPHFTTILVVSSGVGKDGGFLELNDGVSIESIQTASPATVLGR